MTRKNRDPQARERIVEVAQRVVADLGVRGATVRAIASAAGVSTGYVMHYFEDKQQLADAVLDRTNQRAGTRVQAASRKGRGIAALTSAVEQLLPLDGERRLEWRVWGAFWSDSHGDAAGARGLPAGRRGLTAILVGPLADAVADGELPEGLDLSYEAVRLMTLAAGLGLTAAGSAGETQALARRMLDDHLSTLRAGNQEVHP